MSKTSYVTYEAFGAIGDGVHDDLPAIVAAHDYANGHGLPVKSKPDATYHLYKRPLIVMIGTDTDWSTSRFTIDDWRVEDHRKPIFEVRSLLESTDLRLNRLTRDQRYVDVHPESDCYVRVEDSHKMRYIRRGLNQNKGVRQQDCFILHSDGSIEGDIDWDYDYPTYTEALPIDTTPLTIKGGVFTTFANRMEQPVGYNYWARNIVITRSNTVVDGLTHYVAGETAVGHPYGGFISVQNCANVTLKDCWFTGHKIYTTIGSAGKPVSMGSYDINANNVVNFTLKGCKMNHICDRTRWGVIGTNFCKNILVEDCSLSRMDTHMGVSGTYTIRRCELGHMGLNAIGRGLLTIEDSTLHGRALVSFRGDYGSTWDGDVVICNSTWIPACGEENWPSMINVWNDGMHDFGYACSMPHAFEIDGLTIDDSNHPEDYTGLYLFSDPDEVHSGIDEDAPTEERPYPYEPCHKVVLRNVQTASGLPVQVSPNASLRDSVVVEAG